MHPLLVGRVLLRLGKECLQLLKGTSNLRLLLLAATYLGLQLSEVLGTVPVTELHFTQFNKN